jgi:hypothetical protein
MRQFRVLVMMLCGVVSAGGGLEAQHAKPAFRYVPPAEAIRVYWADALNQFKAVRAPAIHDAEPPGATSSVRYDLLTVPQGAPVWDAFGEHPLVTEMRGRSALRGGQPQVKLGVVVARVRSRAAAETLFKELAPVVSGLPGAQPRGPQDKFWVSVGVRARPARRILVLQLPDEPDDPETGTYAIGLDVSFNEDDPSWDGGGGGEEPLR